MGDAGNSSNASNARPVESFALANDSTAPLYLNFNVWYSQKAVPHKLIDRGVGRSI